MVSVARVLLEKEASLKTVLSLIQNRPKLHKVIKPESSIIDAITLMSEENTGALLVCEKQKLIGIVSERDLIHLLADSATVDRNLPVKKVMSRQLVTVEPSESIEAAVELMRANKVRHLPVVNQKDDLVGFIDIFDVVSAIDSIKSETIKHLEEYISETWPF